MLEGRVSFYPFVKKPDGIEAGVALNLDTDLRRTGIVAALNLLTNDRRVTLHLFRTSFISLRTISNVQGTDLAHRLSVRSLHLSHFC